MIQLPDDHVIICGSVYCVIGKHEQDNWNLAPKERHASISIYAQRTRLEQLVISLINGSEDGKRILCDRIRNR